MDTLSLKMRHQEFESPAELQDTIKCFWYNTGNFGEIESGFEVQPDGFAEIIFYFGSSCSISYNGSLQPLPSPFMMGLLDKPVILYAKNRLEVIGIRCFPWTVFDLLGLPSGKHGVYLFEHPMAALQSSLEKMVVSGNIEEAITLLKEYFLDKQLPKTTDNILLKAGVAMSSTKGSMPVGQVAAASHATLRTLERKFKQSSGYTVKDVSGLMRFEQIRNQLWHYPDSNLAGLAQELGYTDQSHMSREFKRYSGATPAAFARKAKKQAIHDFVAFIQA